MTTPLLDQHKTTALVELQAERLREMVRKRSVTYAAKLFGSSTFLVEKLLDGGKSKAESVARIGALLDAQKCKACIACERCEHWPT